MQGGITTAATIRRHGLNDAFRNVSVNGARPASVSYMVDGISVNEPLFQTPSIIPPIDVIQEFKLQNSLYSAEFGMGAAQVSVALKSGTNGLHGVAVGVSAQRRATAFESKIPHQPSAETESIWRRSGRPDPDPQDL